MSLTPPSNQFDIFSDLHILVKGAIRIDRETSTAILSNRSSFRNHSAIERLFEQRECVLNSELGETNSFH